MIHGSWKGSNRIQVLSTIMVLPSIYQFCIYTEWLKVLFGLATSSRDTRQMVINYKKAVRGLGCMSIKG